MRASLVLWIAVKTAPNMQTRQVLSLSAINAQLQRAAARRANNSSRSSRLLQQTRMVLDRKLKRLDCPNLQFKPGSPSRREVLATLRAKKAWDMALAPAKSVPMQVRHRSRVRQRMPDSKLVDRAS